MMEWSGGSMQLDPMQESAAGPRRSRSGCTLCRARKVKCDEKWPTCLNCERLKLECPGPPAPGSIANPRSHRQGDRDTKFTQAGTLRQRVAKSCQQCRAAKARCSGGALCSRCARKGLDCSSVPVSRQAKKGQNQVSRELMERSVSADVDSASQPSMQKNFAPFSFQSTSDDPINPFSWLYATELPTGERLWILVEEYFAHIHPLRCNGFVHKPSFMQRLDEDVASCRQSESLLHVICALGAKFFALSNSTHMSSEAILTAGNQWAKIAKARIFIDMDDLSLEKLMTAILLYDHDLRIGSYASAFMLSGITARMSQALQLSLENSPDVLCTKPESSAVNTETRRRLMWSCYLLDSWVGSGVNQLTLLEDRDLKIQLPCHSHNFSLGIPCITETLDYGKTLSFLSNDQIPPDPSQNMGIEAYFIRLVSIRKKVLRYVKHLDPGKPPWQADSEFTQLSEEFQAWRRTLPQSLAWNPGAIYARKESSQLGALTLLWCTFYQTLVDLYRIGMPALFRIQKEISFPPEQQGFLKRCRRICFDNAREVSNILLEALRHGLKILADTWLCIIAHDSTKVMLHYLKLCETSASGIQAKERDTIIALVQSNLDALLQMRSMVTTAEHCSVSVVRMMAAAGIQPDIPFTTLTNDVSQEDSKDTSPPSGSPAQESPENVLNPLAIYRMARTALHEKDTQSQSSHSPSTQNNTSSPHFTPRSTQFQQTSNPDMGTPTGSYQQSQGSFPGGGDISALDQLYPPSQQNREDAGMGFNPLLALGSGIGGAWDPADLAVMDMLDGGITPWTADYLTDGQSGVDPFLFPF